MEVVLFSACDHKEPQSLGVSTAHICNSSCVVMWMQPNAAVPADGAEQDLPARGGRPLMVQCNVPLAAHVTCTAFKLCQGNSPWLSAASMLMLVAGFKQCQT